MIKLGGSRIILCRVLNQAAKVTVIEQLNIGGMAEVLSHRDLRGPLLLHKDLLMRHTPQMLSGGIEGEGGHRMGNLQRAMASLCEENQNRQFSTSI